MVDVATSDSASGSSGAADASGGDKVRPAEDKATRDSATSSEPAAQKAKPVGPLMAAYFLARVGVFAVLVVVFYFVHFRGFPGLIAAAIVSIPVSYLVCRGWRAELARRMADRHEQKLQIKQEFKTATD